MFKSPCCKTSACLDLEPPVELDSTQKEKKKPPSLYSEGKIALEKSEAEALIYHWRVSSLIVRLKICP